ncbi:MAG: nickel-dependent lactate racemase [Anaerolineales bacterium]
MDKLIPLNYGNKTVSINIPANNLLGIFEPTIIPPVADLTQSLRQALSAPLGCLPLEELIHKEDKIVILVDDHTRSTPAASLLPEVIKTLKLASVPDEQITIMITHGTHRLSTEEEVIHKVGAEIYQRYRVVQHRCDEEENQVFLGITQRGTPVWINRLVVEADKRIGIGHIGPSPYAGYSGGLKLIVPGVAALDTINANHSMVPLGFRKAGAIDIPTRQDIEEAAGMLGIDFLIDVVLDRNDQVLKVFAGEPGAVYQAGVALAKKVFEVTLPQPVDIAITSAFPYDLDLYQGVRAVEYADAVVRQGGSILLVAALPEGWGDEEFHNLMKDRTKSPEHFLRDITRRHGKVTFNVLGYNLAMIKQEKKLSIYTEGIPASELEEAGFNCVHKLQEGIDELLQKYGQRSTVAVFPIGSASVARIQC